MKILNGITLTGNASINANSLIVGTNQLVATNGRIGVGTTSPSQLFSVGGTSDLNGIIIDGAKIYTPGADLKLISGGPQSDRNNIFLINNGGIIIDGGSSETAGVQIKGGGGNVRVTQGILQVDTGSALNTITSYFTTGNNDGGFRLGFANGSGASLNTEQGALVFTYGGTRIGSIGFNRGGSANCDAITFSTSTNNERMRITSAGNVGIGTSSPVVRLDLGGSIGEKLNLYTGGVNRIGFGVDMGQTFNGLSSFTNSAFNWGIWDGTTFTERMRLTSSGSFGIGATTSVSGKLQIYEATSSGNTTEMLRFAWQDNNWGMKIDQIHTGGAIDYAFRIRNQGATYNELLYMKPTGRIGIGNISPAAELHITDSNPEILRLERTGGFGNAAIGVSSSGSMVFFGKPQIGNFAVGASFDLTSSPYLTIASNGNIGIGAGSTPADKLHLEGNLYLGTTSRTIYTAGSANLVFQTNTGTMIFLRNAAANESMRISSGGSLGVGTQSPIAKVDVVGEVRTSDKFGYGASAYTQYNSTTKSIDFIFA